jgi:hypothetical protein
VGIVLEAKHYFNALACANKNICDDSNLIQISMSVGHSFALVENGYAVSGAGEKRRVAWTQALAEMPVVWSGGWRELRPRFCGRFLHGDRLSQSPRSHGVPVCR